MRTFLRILFPLLVLALGVGVMLGLKATRKPVQPSEVVQVDPLVRVKIVQPKQVKLWVDSQGTVMPGVAIGLISEVTGTVEMAAEAMAAGGYFEEGDVLLKIDPVDYELAVVQAKARLLEAKARLMREEAEAEVARMEWEELGRDGEASALVLREPQLAEARAAVESAEANVRLAERDLAKTTIRAPFAGRVLSTDADAGQYVTKGTQLARIYSIETAEIRLPLTAQELAYVNVPFNFRGESAQVHQPSVTLQAKLGGREWTWQGRVVRTEGEVDPRTRMLTAVAEVENPYGRQGDGNTPPLAAGLFVRAEIEGETFDNVFELPRTALRGRTRVFVIDAEDRLQFRDVEVLRAGQESVIIRSGLEAGDRVCLSPLETPVENMKVRVAEEVLNGGSATMSGGVS